MSSSQPAQPPLRIAISGGGLAGATLLTALLPHPHLSVHIFESAEAFKEKGQAINVLKNGVNSLKLLNAFECLERAGAVRQNQGIYILAGGRDLGAQVGRIGEAGFSYKVHRAQLLGELLRDVPGDRMHVLKKLVGVDEESECLRLRFEDGSTHECDVLIGADGVWSNVRKFVLGEDHPAVTAVYAGWSTLWQLQPVEVMRREVGSKYFDLADPCQYYWLGDGAYIQHDLLSNGELCTCIAAYPTGESWNGERWGKVADKDEVRRAYAKFPDHLKNGMIELMLADENPAIFPMWEHPHAPTYSRGRICVLGDAAHTSTPWMGSGGGMSMEDAVVLSSLLGHSKTTEQAIQALKVYDETRRPRGERLVEASQETGCLHTGRLEGVDLVKEEMTEAVKDRFKWILDFDIEGQRDEAVSTLLTRLGV